MLYTNLFPGDDIYKHYSLQSDPIRHVCFIDVTLYELYNKYCLNQSIMCLFPLRLVFDRTLTDGAEMLHALLVRLN